MVRTRNRAGDEDGGMRLFFVNTRACGSGPIKAKSQWLCGSSWALYRREGVMVMVVE